MPTAQIEVRRQYSEADEVGIIDAVHAALVDAFRIPAEDKHVRLVVHEPHRFASSPKHANPEFCTLITIDCYAGRSIEAKRKLYSQIVQRLAPFGIDPLDVLITVREFPIENWGIRGGQAACDVNFGFTVEV
ncbi:tautomerase family protein [Hoyosella rhizosphaerae]|uniref:Tautomerase family protein n=1 Tax=Hoyosella rhizosphaerae TaxID=1755582 RepID=A0A916U3L3_9ACTN|nr:tautomerase family protein [Hoyosella rhizosphaerae]MBN4926855.1 tautomerase family protein [Hoyosella rhizosphaerae]GGC55982.1 hypothetical protein GCM10011410_05490 [Hoyosella rhizosphaerae]